MTRCLTTAALGTGGLCAGLLLVTTIAVADTPHGPPMMPASGPPTLAYGPLTPAPSPPTTMYNRPMQAFGPADAPVNGAAHFSPRPHPGQIRMRQDRTEDQYLLILDLEGLPPEHVEVRPFGRSLMVRVHVDARARRSESFDDGRGYRESYRISTGSRTRRLPVPPDADLAGLERVDSEQQVRVMIPRTAAQAAPAWR